MHYQRWYADVGDGLSIDHPGGMDAARVNEAGDDATATLVAYAAEAAEQAYALIDAMTDPAMAAECRDRQDRLQVALTPEEQAIRKACQEKFGIYEPTEGPQARFIDQLHKTKPRR